MERTDVDAILSALEARHGIDPASSELALRARVELALSELGTPAHLDAGFLERVAQRMRVGETRFFRDQEQLDALARGAIPRALARGRCRALSAGCSTGEEAYTLSMLIEHARDERRDVDWEVIGIDVGEASISLARAGKYARSALASVPAQHRRCFVDRGEEVSIAPSIASRCAFVVGDLLTLALPAPCDVILCRNVLIYLADAASKTLIERLVAALDDEGVLVVARAEAPVVRRSGLFAIGADAGRAAIAGFSRRKRSRPRPPARKIVKTPIDDSPPSRVRLVLDADSPPEAIVARGQALLARGAGMLELYAPNEIPEERLRALELPLLRLVAAARALGAHCVTADDATARLLSALGVQADRT